MIQLQTELKDGQFLFVRAALDETEFRLQESVGGARYFFSYSVPHWKLEQGRIPATQFAVLLDHLQKELAKIIGKES